MPLPGRGRLNWFIALFALVVVVIVDGIILAGVMRQRQQVLDDAARQGERIARALSEHASQVIGRADQALLGVIDAMTPQLLAAGADDPDVGANLQRYLAPIPYASGLAVIDAAQRTRNAASSLSWLHEAPSFVPPACQGVEQAVAPLLAPDTQPGKTYVTLTERQFDCRSQLVVAKRVSAADRPGIVVAIVIEPYYFQRHYDSLTDGVGASAALWLAGGRIAIGNSVVAAVIGNEPAAVAAEELIDAVENDRRPQTLTLNDGAPRLMSIQGVPQLPLIAAVRLNTDDLLKPWRSRAMDATIAAGVVTLAILGMGLALMRVARRIELARAALRTSEQRFRDFAASAADWYWEQDENLRFTYLSPNVAQHTSHPVADHIGKTRRDLNPLGPNERGWAEHEAETAARLPFKNLHLHRIAPDGRLRHFTVSGVPVFDEDGRFQGYRGTGRDMTAEVEAREALRAVIDAVPAMINAKGLDSRYVMMNAYQAKIYGTTSSEAIGKTADDFLGTGYGSYTRTRDRQVLETGQATEFYEERYADADGVERDWLSIKVPLLDAAGRVHRIISVSTDITNRKATERRLSEARRELQAALEAAEGASRAKTNFLANMSHELRTPLNAILGFSEIMETEIMGPIGSPRYREFAAGIHKSGQMLLQLINDVLDMAKIEAGHRPLVRDWVDLRRVADDAVLVVRQRAENGGIALDVDIAPALPAFHGDQRALAQILVNLLTNAVKFTPPGGTVALSIRHVDGRFMLAVSDTGIGIPASMLGRLGTPFLQVESSMTRSHEGTGLGLALTKSLVALHGGTFAIASEEGKGTTVTVNLPQDVANSDAAA